MLILIDKNNIQKLTDFGLRESVDYFLKHLKSVSIHFAQHAFTEWNSIYVSNALNLAIRSVCSQDHLNDRYLSMIRRYSQINKVTDADWHV